MFPAGVLSSPPGGGIYDLVGILARGDRLRGVDLVGHDRFEMALLEEEVNGSQTIN